MLKKALIVDDAEAALFVAQVVLGNHGIKTFEASSIQDAKDCIESTDINAIFIDWHIGAESGLDFVRELRAQGNHTPVIVVSGFEVSDRSVLEALDAGAQAFIQKPLTEENLSIALKECKFNEG